MIRIFQHTPFVTFKGMDENTEKYVLLLEIKDLEEETGAESFIEEFIMENLQREYTEALFAKLKALEKDDLSRLALKCLTKELRQMFGPLLFKMHKENIITMLLFADQACGDSNLLACRKVFLSQKELMHLFHHCIEHYTLEELRHIRHNFESFLTQEVDAE